MVVMIVLAFAIDARAAAPLVNQPQIILFMATIGLNSPRRAGRDGVGANVKKLDVGIPDRFVHLKGVQINQLGLVAALTAAVLVTVLAVFSSARASARPCARWPTTTSSAVHRHSVSRRSGSWCGRWRISRDRGGDHVGRQSGVQFSLSLIALKALPVLILGGFESVPGAILGGLIIGWARRAASLLGTVVGGAIENWFAYVLALAFLLPPRGPKPVSAKR